MFTVDVVYPERGVVVSEKNQLLAGLSSENLKLLQPHLERVRIVVGQALEEPNEPIEYVYFLESGIASIMALVDGDGTIEAGPFGREGMSGIPIVMGTDRSPHRSIVQIAGYAQRLPAVTLRRVIGESVSLHVRLLHYVQAFSVQTAHTVLANGFLNVEHRLARWLLMVDDRSDERELPLTHDFIALMLGVRRAGVTVAVQELESRGLVRARRGRITVLDREQLQNMCAGFYGVPEAEYARLLGGALVAG